MEKNLALENTHQNEQFTVISAEQYEIIRQQIMSQYKPIITQKRPVCTATDKLGKSIEAMASSLSVAVIEALIGRRPLKQIERWFSKSCYETVRRRASVTRDAIACQYANPAASYSPYSKTIKLPKVKRARAQKVAEGKYEVCVLITDGSRTRAMALRIEKYYKNWHITEIEIA